MKTEALLKQLDNEMFNGPWPVDIGEDKGEFYRQLVIAYIINSYGTGVCSNKELNRMIKICRHYEGLDVMVDHIMYAVSRLPPPEMVPVFHQQTLQ